MLVLVLHSGVDAVAKACCLIYKSCYLDLVWKLCVAVLLIGLDLENDSSKLLWLKVCLSKCVCV